MAKAIGIDLGTTNSVACYFDGREVKVLLNTYHEELTPSVVAFQRLDEEEDGEIVVGQPAVSQAKLYPRDTIYSIKRLMGRRFANEKVQEWRSKVTYDVVEATEPVKGMAAVTMGGKTYMPEDISAMILKHIKSYAEKALGDQITHAVITVPAYFGEPERAATRDAGLKAGLVVKTLLAEPTAACLAFGAQLAATDGFILVYDLGGGTFDLSVLSMVGLREGTPNYNVMAIGGDHFLGGDDFDLVILDMLVEHVREKHGIDLSTDIQFRIVARDEAKRAKEILSAEPGARITNPNAVQRDGKDIGLRLKLTREDLEKRIAHYVERAKNLVLEKLKEQSLSPDDITDVLLVGGATSVPLVSRSMEELFGKDKIRRTVNPMHCVAIGAGILAHRMKGVECPKEGCATICDEAMSACPTCGTSLAVASAAIEGMTVTDATANKVGIQKVSGADPHVFHVLVQSGTPLPMHKPEFETLFTTQEGQAIIRVPVYEGQGSTVIQNTKIGEIQFPLPLGLGINHPVRVGLQLDRNKIAQVTVEVVGYDALRYEQQLKHEFKEEVEPQPEAEPSALLEDDEQADEGERNLAMLERFITRAETFREHYQRVLSPNHVRKLDKAIEDARRIYDDDKGSEAMAALLKLDRVLATSGTASLIDQGRLAAASADAASAEKLNRLADELERHAEAGNTAVLQKLAGPVTDLIRQVYARQKQVDSVETAPTFGGLLGDKQQQK